MDFKVMPWTGNIYEKFEAMCLEVEEVMYQDTVKYMENQVQKVGVSVKKFYSEIMQDLLPPSCVDPVKVAASDLSLNPCAHSDMNEKPKASMLGNSELKKESTEDKVTADEDVGKKLSLSGLGDKSNTSSLCKMKESCVAPGESHTSSLILSVYCAMQKEEVSFCTSSPHLLPSESIGMFLDGDVVSQQGSNISSNKCNIKSGIEEVIISDEGAEDNFDIDIIRNNEVVEQRADITKQDEKSKLEESCVLVEGDKLCFFTPGPARQKSYKKKIREAFLSKLRSRKEEYGNLVVQYGNLDGMEGTEMVIPGSNIIFDNVKLQGCNFSDSDWELL
ncbi:uncharacterized protein Fot_40572 [Forsythia ovata]|uniref:Uncharacterized protein n=1 Tax=Forsythia ovata TaxID=205694 RepID=A0ABD1S846_9LAMI